MYKMKTNYNKNFSEEKKYGIQGLKQTLMVADEVAIEKEEDQEPKIDVRKTLFPPHLKEGLVNTTALNLREKPTKDSAVKHVLKRDDVLIIRGIKDDWVDVQHTKTGIEGFVMEDFVFIARVDQ